jgi:hypothetical protein
VSRGLLLFGAWCLLMVGVAGMAGWTAWDPFADGSGARQGPGERSHHRSVFGGFWGGYGGYGPTHK